MAVPAHKTEYFIIENSNLQKKANTAELSELCDDDAMCSDTGQHAEACILL